MVTKLVDNCSEESYKMPLRNYHRLVLEIYRKVPKFSDARKLCCNLLKIQTQRSNLRAFHRKDANGKANSEDPDQTAPLGAV